MNIIDISTVNKPMNPKGFEILEQSEYPYCILGFQIKNEYDRLRHKIPEKYNPSDIVHFVNFPEVTPHFFRGIKIEPSKQLRELIDYIDSKRTNILKEITPKAYTDILATKGFSASECNHWLNVGIYPIDSCHIDSLSETFIDINKLYEDIFSNKDIPCFQSVGYLCIYVLNSYMHNSSTNQSILKKLYNGYKNDIQEELNKKEGARLFN